MPRRDYTPRNDEIKTMSRLILHIDFNSFFASVEAQANPFLRGKAFAVAGKGKGRIDREAGAIQGARTSIAELSHTRSVITTASREAKNLGVKTAMTTHEAQRIIPNLPIIPGDPRKYAEITHRFLKILREHCDAVEQFSVDEAFADITTAAGDKFGAIVFAQILRSEIVGTIGEACTASIGIGPNKVIAKLASELVKPNGITYVDPSEVESFVAARSLRDICGIGPRLSKRLINLGITTILHLRTTPLDRLVSEFGPHTAQFLWNVSRGIGDDHVIDSESDDPKSVGHSYTFPRGLETDDEIHDNLLALADMVAQRLRNQNLFATHVNVFARYEDGGGSGTSASLPEATNDGLTLFDHGFRSLLPMINLDRGIRLLGISATQFAKKIPSLLPEHNERYHRCITALDLIAKKFGTGAWHRASTLNTVFLERVSGWHYDHE